MNKRSVYQKGIEKIHHAICDKWKIDFSYDLPFYYQITDYGSTEREQYINLCNSLVGYPNILFHYIYIELDKWEQLPLSMRLTFTLSEYYENILGIRTKIMPNVQVFGTKYIPPCLIGPGIPIIERLDDVANSPPRFRTDIGHYLLATKCFESIPGISTTEDVVKTRNPYDLLTDKLNFSRNNDSIDGIYTAQVLLELLAYEESLKRQYKDP